MIDKHNEAEIETSGAQGIERTEKLIAAETCIGRIRRARLKGGTLLNDVPVYYGNAVFWKLVQDSTWLRKLTERC